MNITERLALLAVKPSLRHAVGKGVMTDYMHANENLRSYYVSGFLVLCPAVCGIIYVSYIIRK
jgi:hypothetical protein